MVSTKQKHFALKFNHNQMEQVLLSMSVNCFDQNDNKKSCKSQAFLFLKLYVFDNIIHFETFTIVLYLAFEL